MKFRYLLSTSTVAGTVAVGILTAALLAGGASPVRAETINYSSNPYPGFNPPVGSATSSGSFDLSPGVHTTETVWAWDVFFNPTTTFSGVSFPVALTLDGVTESVPFTISATAGSGQYSFASDGTVEFDLAGVGVVDVTGLAVVTSISDPADAGPEQADFFLEPAAVPEPASLALLGPALVSFGFLARRRRATIR